MILITHHFFQGIPQAAMRSIRGPFAWLLSPISRVVAVDLRFPADTSALNLGDHGHNFSGTLRKQHNERTRQQVGNCVFVLCVVCVFVFFFYLQMFQKGMSFFHMTKCKRCKPQDGEGHLTKFGGLYADGVTVENDPETCF